MAQIDKVSKISKEIKEKMEADLVAYEHRHGVDVNYEKFSLVLTLLSGEVAGVLSGYTGYDEIYVDELWVNSKYRGMGNGRQLLHDLEMRFSGKGFHSITLCTNEFQAPGFYEKCGYTLEFVRRTNKDPKLVRYFYCKLFNEGPPTQGLIQC